MKKTDVVRKTVGDTDIGKNLKDEIQTLNELLEAYQKGDIK